MEHKRWPCSKPDRTDVKIILGATAVAHPPLAPEVALHLAGNVTDLWETLARSGRRPEDCFPYWAVAWVGGQAIARYVLDHPDLVAGRRVLDFAAGSGLGGIAAMTAGARSAIAAEIDPLGRTAIELNGTLNAVTVAVQAENAVESEPRAIDLILAGDVCYEREMTARVLPWLRSMQRRGTRVLIGDPGREYLPREGLTLLAQYEVRTAREVEGVECKHAAVYALADDGLVPEP